MGFNSGFKGLHFFIVPIIHSFPPPWINQYFVMPHICLILITRWINIGCGQIKTTHTTSHRTRQVLLTRTRTKNLNAVVNYLHKLRPDKSSPVWFCLESNWSFAFLCQTLNYQKNIWAEHTNSLDTEILIEFLHSPNFIILSHITHTYIYVYIYI